MGEQSFDRWIPAADCPLTWKGRNLTELRRVTLREVAQRLNVDADGSKNAIIGRLIESTGGKQCELSEVSSSE